MMLGSVLHEGLEPTTESGLSLNLSMGLAVSLT